MQNSPATLIQSVAKANGINFQHTTAAGIFSAYVLTMREIGLILSNNLVNFPAESVLLIQEAMTEIRNSCNTFIQSDIERMLREAIVSIRQVLVEALAQINRAAAIYHQTIHNPRMFYQMYDIFQESLGLCGNIIIDINFLLNGWEIVK
jgi:hypothetical protein